MMLNASENYINILFSAHLQCRSKGKVSMQSLCILCKLLLEFHLLLTMLVLLRHWVLTESGSTVHITEVNNTSITDCGSPEAATGVAGIKILRLCSWSCGSQSWYFKWKTNESCHIIIYYICSSNSHVALFLKILLQPLDTFLKVQHEAWQHLGKAVTVCRCKMGVAITQPTIFCDVCQNFPIFSFYKELEVKKY